MQFYKPWIKMQVEIQDGDQKVKKNCGLIESFMKIILQYWDLFKTKYKISWNKMKCMCIPIFST
jgi:5-methylthioribose kinase